MRRAILFGFTVCFGLLLSWMLTRPSISTVPFVVEIAPGQSLAGRVYTPRAFAAGKDGTMPALLFCHGVNSSKDTLAPLAQEFARQGMAAVVFDFGGYGQSYRRANDQTANIRDATVVLEWMHTQPQFDQNRLGIVGHSMGGTTALEVAKAHDELKTTILLSIAGRATPTVPSNLFLGSGVYDQLNPVAGMQSFFQDAIGSPNALATSKQSAPMTSRIVGNFAEGTARQIVFSPTADHAIAPYDTFLHRAAIQWAKRSFGLPLESVPMHIQFFLWGYIVMGLGSFGLCFWAYQQWQQQAAWFPNFGLGLLIISHRVMFPQDIASGFVLMLLAVLVIGNYRPTMPQTGWPIVKQWVMYSGLVYGLLLLAIAFNALITGSLIAFPHALLSLPILAKNLAIGLLYDRFHMVRYAVESRLGVIIVLGLVILEQIKPGIIVRGLGAIATHILKTLRQPISWQWTPASKQRLLLLPLLLGLLIAILIQQQRAGILTLEAGRFALRLIGIFVLFPGMMFAGIVRSPLFLSLEHRWVGINPREPRLSGPQKT